MNVAVHQLKKNDLLVMTNPIDKKETSSMVVSAERDDRDPKRPGEWWLVKLAEGGPLLYPRGEQLQVARDS